jgi:glycosyltransferase involved in cell wall biosynthesis
MRVAIDAHMVGTQETGNETYVKYLIQALQKMDRPGFEIDVLQTAESTSPLDPALPRRGFRLLQVRPTHSVGRICWGIPYMVRQEQVDVLHMTYNAPFWTRQSAQVVMVHDLAYKLYPHYYSPRVRWVLATLVPLSARRAERVVVPSEHTKKDVAREYGVPEHKILVTPEAAAPEFRVVEDQTRIETTLSRYSIRRGYLLAVGNLEPRKNLGRIVRAYAALLSRGSFAHQLVIVGQAHWQGSVVGREIKERGLEKHVVLTGYLPTEELVDLYNAADVFCYPSLYEGFGLPILEGMSCGAPVITSRVSSMPEVAGDAALLVDPKSEQELAQAMERILADVKLRREMREQGLRRAAEFSWTRTAERTLQAYREACAEHSRCRKVA